MRFIFKQSCFLACFMIYDAWGVIPDYLVKLEQEFWSGLRLSATAKKDAKKAVQKIRDPQFDMGPSEEVDFSDMKKWEIVSRHAADTFQEGDSRLLNGSDEFHDLPIGLGLAMADRLIFENEIDLSDSWIKDKAYHLYTENKATREEAFEQLYEKYQQTYMQNFSEEKKKISLLDLLKKYFKTLEEDPEENPFISDSSSEM